MQLEIGSTRIRNKILFVFFFLFFTTAHTAYTRTFYREVFQPFLPSCLSHWVTVPGNYINYRVSKNVILDNLCSELIIAGKENCFSSPLIYIYPNSVRSTGYYFIGLFCKHYNFAFFSQGQLLVCHEEYLHMGLFRSVPLYLHQIIFDKGCKRPINPTS